MSGDEVCKLSENKLSSKHKEKLWIIFQYVRNLNEVVRSTAGSLLAQILGILECDEIIPDTSGQAPYKV